MSVGEREQGFQGFWTGRGAFFLPAKKTTVQFTLLQYSTQIQGGLV